MLRLHFSLWISAFIASPSREGKQMPNKVECVVAVFAKQNADRDMRFNTNGAEKTNRTAKTFFVVGLSFKTAPVELRERVSIRQSKLGCSGCHLKIAGELSEVVVLSTCNRLEIYGATTRLNVPVDELLGCIAPNDLDLKPYVYVHEGNAMLRHLFSVAGGLDSMVLGETEITGQIKNAYTAAKEARLTGPILNRVFQTAQQTAKEIRTQTHIGRGATSVGSAAVELVEKIFGGDLATKTIMIIGAGKMGEACVRHLAKRGAKSVLVSNRSFERAEELAKAVGGRAIRFDDCQNAMVEADIVVSSTNAPQMILRRPDIEAVMKARRNRPLVLTDIAVPRDIDPDVQLLQNVYLYNIDDLQEVVRENVQSREKELAQCHSIIEGRATALFAKITTTPSKTYDDPVRTQPEWAFCRPAVAC
jgi:glutamyl-tRNA reductase